MININWQFVSYRILCVYVLLVTISSTNASGRYEVHDSKLKTCLIETAKKNSWQQAKDFTSLKCHSYGIQSLIGIEKFVHLEKLSLYNNKLKRIDIDIAQLTKLRELNIARNQLETIDFKDLAKLTKLYLFGNQLRSLSLNGLFSLKALRANNNKIATFNYADVPSLEKIYIFNNKLEEVNIYGFPSLQYMDCRENPMPDELYDQMDRMEKVTFLHDGNAEDW